MTGKPSCPVRREAARKRTFKAPRRAADPTVIGGAPDSANPSMTSRPVALCASDAARGMFPAPVRPSAAGSTFSLPKANT